MNTKEISVSMNLRIPKNLKEDFSALADELGTNSANLLKMFMKDAVRERKVQFSASPFTEFEIEEFSEEEMNDLLSSKSIQRNMKKMNEIFSNLEKGK